MDKHAYLIMAHNNYDYLNKLISVLDDPRNDIYLHIDAKDTLFCEDQLIPPENSNLFYIERKKIYWGGFSQTICELDLLQEAVKKEYAYYHLLSGADFPIKSQNYIHNFFSINKGYEFVGFDNEWNENKIKYRQYYTDVGRDKKITTIAKKIINLIYLKLQKITRRTPTYDIKVYKGANWFSITHDLALFVLENRKLIYDNFSNILNSDEFFLQSIVGNSDFSKKVYKGMSAEEYESNMRHIDWSRGEPYTFKENDLDELLNSHKLFARKFDGKNELGLVDKIIKHLKEIYS
jgi:hypothetical protein